MSSPPRDRPAIHLWPSQASPEADPGRRSPGFRVLDPIAEAKQDGDNLSMSSDSVSDVAVNGSAYAPTYVDGVLTTPMDSTFNGSPQEMIEQLRPDIMHDPINDLIDTISPDDARLLLRELCDGGYHIRVKARRMLNSLRLKQADIENFRRMKHKEEMLMETCRGCGHEYTERENEIGSCSYYTYHPRKFKLSGHFGMQAICEVCNGSCETTGCQRWHHVPMPRQLDWMSEEEKMIEQHLRSSMLARYKKKTPHLRRVSTAAEQEQEMPGRLGSPMTRYPSYPKPATRRSLSTVLEMESESDPSSACTEDSEEEDVRPVQLYVEYDSLGRPHTQVRNHLKTRGSLASRGSWK